MSFSEIIIFGILINITAGLGALFFSYIEDKVGPKYVINLSLIFLIVIGGITLFLNSKEWFLIFAFKIAKHVKSNAIIYAKNNSTVGIGAGQMSRIDSSQIAAIKSKKASELAGLKANMAEGSVLASDAFFPFADGLIAAAEAGVTSIIQPGGSIRDDEVIDAANKLGLSMVFSGIRHFRH